MWYNFPKRSQGATLHICQNYMNSSLVLEPPPPLIWVGAPFHTLSKLYDVPIGFVIPLIPARGYSNAAVVPSVCPCVRHALTLWTQYKLSLCVPNHQTWQTCSIWWEDEACWFCRSKVKVTIDINGSKLVTTIVGHHWQMWGAWGCYALRCNILGSVFPLYLRSPKVGCCSISDDLTRFFFTCMIL